MGWYRFSGPIATLAKLVTICVGTLLCLGAMPVQGIATATNETDRGQSLDAVLSHADAYSQQVHSGRFLFRTEADFPNQEEQNFVEETEVWFDGVRCRVEQSQNFPREKGVLEDLTVFDGEKVIRTGVQSHEVARVTPVMNLGELPRLVGGVRTPFSEAIGPAFNHSLPLGSLIRAWGGRLAAVEEVNGEPCYHLTAGPQFGSGWQITRSWWLSPSKGYAPVRYLEDVVWETGQTAEKRSEHTVEEWLQVRSTLWLPRIVTKRIYIRKQGGLEQLEGTQTTTMLASDPDADVSDNLFRLELPDMTRATQGP